MADLRAVRVSVRNALRHHDSKWEERWAQRAIIEVIQEFSFDVPAEKFVPDTYETGADYDDRLAWAAKIRARRNGLKAFVRFNARAFVLDGEPSAELLASVVFHEYVAHGEQLLPDGSDWTLAKPEREVEAYLRQIDFVQRHGLGTRVAAYARHQLDSIYGAPSVAMLARIQQRFPGLGLSAAYA